MKRKNWPAIILITVLFWPFILTWYLVKFLLKQRALSHSEAIKSAGVADKAKAQPTQNGELSVISDGDIIDSMRIPEPTRSMLFTTDEHPSKIESAGGITITININTGSANQEEHSFFSEPSLIWTKLPIKQNSWLEEKAMYWPAYSQFTPEHRYQYLKWLTNIEQPTNLSYVFLYFYGLERHLLIGEYDKAVDEILRLLKAHKKPSFRSYAARSLIVASMYRKRLDITERAPFLLEEEVDEALALRIAQGTSMSPEDIISVASRAGYTNKRYIKLYPERYISKLQDVVDEFESQHGKLLSFFKLSEFRSEETSVFANLSIPERARLTKVPQILENKQFQAAIFNLLSEAHSRLKDELIEERTNTSIKRV